MHRRLLKSLRVNTIQFYYMLLFIVGTICNIICSNLKKDIYNKLTSCYNKGDYVLFPFCILCILQCLLLIPKKRGYGLINSSRDNFDLAHTKILLAGFNSYISDNSPINNSIKSAKTNIKNQETSLSTNTKIFESDFTSDSYDCNIENKSYGYEICWDSIWTIFFNAIFFLTAHSSLLASRIFGTIPSNKKAIETCGHLKDFAISLGSKSLNTPIISETVFILIFLSFITHSMCIRRTGDPYSTRHFISFPFFSESKLFGFFRFIVQIVIFCYAFTIIGMITINRTCPTLHVISGISMGFICLWLISVLSHVLQIDQPRYNFTSNLSFIWLWPMIVAFSIWLCGYLFYTSVYGPCLLTLYPYIHFVTILSFTMITLIKGSKIFDWTPLPTDIINNIN